jgi:Ca2+-transporting ATPase
MAGIKNTENVMEGEAFMKLNEVEMLKAIHNTTLNRMFPEAKLAVVNALKDKASCSHGGRWRQ